MNQIRRVYKTLSNGALLLYAAEDCEVCVKKNQEPEVAHFELVYQGKSLKLCDAHAQTVVEMDDDITLKGVTPFVEFFNRQS